MYSFLSRRPGMLRHQSDSRHAIIAYLSYCLKLFVIDDNGGCTASGYLGEIHVEQPEFIYLRPNINLFIRVVHIMAVDLTATI